jgi:hypothetical protein
MNTKQYLQAAQKNISDAVGNISMAQAGSTSDANVTTDVANQLVTLAETERAGLPGSSTGNGEALGVLIELIPDATA